jgi:hypothetical protein
MSENTNPTTGEKTRDRRNFFGLDTDTAVNFHGGIAKAISEGFKAYADEVDTDNVYDFGVGGFLDGVVAGYSSLFEELAKTGRRMIDDARAARTRRDDRRDRSRPAVTTQPIDYERLAQLVAAELQKTAAVKK